MPSVAGRHRDGLIAATARVAAGGATGTGFFVAPGLLVTCAHVVPPGEAVRVSRHDAECAGDVVVRLEDDVSRSYSYPDVALVRADLPGHGCVRLRAATPPPERKLYAYGCPLVEGRPTWDHMQLEAEGERVPDGAAHRFLKTRKGQVLPGASGSGVIDLVNGEVVGMLKLTRDRELDLGGVLVPAAVVLDSLAAAGHDIAEANRAATEGGNDPAALRRRLAWALLRMHVALSDVGQACRRAMLWELRDDLDELLDGDIGDDDAALALVGLELRRLGDALRTLAKESRSPGSALRLLEVAAAFAWLAGRPLVEPQAAAVLAAERTRELPRLVHVPARSRRGVELHVARAAVDRRWEVVPLAPADGETDAETGLPARLAHAVRCELLKAVGPVDESDPDAVARRWAARRELALGRAHERLLVLPPGSADAATVDALRRVFAPCVFAVAGRDAPPIARAMPEHVLLLSASLTEAAEAEADDAYEDITWLIEQAAR